MLKIKKNKNIAFNRRLFLLTSLQLISFSFLLERLYNLQVRQAEKYKKLAENNRINLSFILPSRGLIFDREKNVLADNKEQYQLLFRHDDAINKLNAIKKVLSLVALDKERKIKILENIYKGVNQNETLIIKNDLSWKEVARISSNITELRGVFIEMRLVRVYYEKSTSHLIGYVGIPDKIVNPKLSKVEGTFVGKLGIELAYDKQLQGKFGIKKEEVNAHGRVVNEISRVNGIPGNDINLSISKNLQNFCHNRLGNDSGSIVTLEIKTGDILSLVSKPSFDSNDFVKEMLPEKWNTIKNNKKKPLFHRASNGIYPPGSIFKLVVAMAAFHNNDFLPDKRYYCSGGFSFGNRVFHCWNDKGHGWVNCKEAISMSCDCYFYELSLKIGIDKIASVANEFGLGKKYLENYFSVTAGLIPTKAWKKEKYGKNWTKSDTIVAGIGQGFALTSPLQLAVMTARIATDGIAVEPNIIKSEKEKKQFTKISMFKKEAYELIKEGMFDAVNNPNGTAFNSRIISKRLMSGKTATSQVRRISMKEREEGIIKNEELPLEQRDHALFVGYYPHINPKYAFSVVVEHGGSGSKSAAPIAKDLCRELELLQI